jgi:hypothetical protein
MNYTDIECSHYRKIAIRLALVRLCVETSFIIFLLYCEQLLCPFGESAFFCELSAGYLDFFSEACKDSPPKAHDQTVDFPFSGLLYRLMQAPNFWGKW